MKCLIGVCGAQASGKTLVILGILRLSRRCGLRVGACKPVDVGETAYLAEDSLGDGESIQQTGRMPEHVSLINPYLLHEKLPPALAAQRDGVRIDKKLLETRLKLLRDSYKRLLIESPGSLRIPLSGTESWAAMLGKWCADVIWISDINEDSLERTLFSFELLQKYGMSVKILLNNRSNERNRELIEYHWLTLEEELSTTVQGLVPYIRGKNRVERVTEVLADIFDENWLEQRDA